MTSSLDELRSVWRRRERPYVLGHRGARHSAPENTMAAFDLALAEGADGVELDVRLDGDGEVIVLHDRTLERMTDGADARDVQRVRSADLSRIAVQGGEHIPRLDTVLDWAQSRRARVNVELKQDVNGRRVLVRRVVELLRRYESAPKSILVSSFHPGIVFALSRLVKQIPVAWLVHDEQRWLRSAPGHRLFGVTAVHPQRTLATPERVVKWQKSGVVLNVWTVNDDGEARALDALGVDGIISDKPGAILDALGR